MSNNSQFEIEVNSEPVRAQLAKLESAVVNPEPLLRIAGQHMRGSIDRTFREQGSPAASWAPLARGTLRGRKSLRAPKSGRGLQGVLGGANLNAGRKILIVSGRLKNSMTQSIEGRTLTIGTNLIYARIQQQGGVAGRGHKAKIPARPYLVFRPEDPQAIATKIETYLEGTAAEGTA